MKQLLQISTIPVGYEIKVQKAQVERRRGSAELQMTREKGGLQIENTPSKVRIDTFEARNSMLPTPPTSIKQAAEKGEQTASETTARWAADNHLMMNAKIGEDVAGQIAERDFMNNLKTGEFEMAFIPKAKPDIQWTKPDISLQFKMDRLKFDLKVSDGDFKYKAGDVSLHVTRMPDVRIRYIGGFNYVPSSSDPARKGVNVMA